MYTRFAKVVLKILTVLGVIAAMIIARVAGDNASGVHNAVLSGLVSFVLALIGIGLFLLFFGMFVELANNVMDIKIYLKGQDCSREGSGINWNTFREEAASQDGRIDWNTFNLPKNKPSQASQAEAVVEERVEKEVSEEHTKPTYKKPENETEWFCSACGVKNEPQALYCASCGNRKHFFEQQ